MINTSEGPLVEHKKNKSDQDMMILVRWQVLLLLQLLNCVLLSPIYFPVKYIVKKIEVDIAVSASQRPQSNLT